MSDDPGVVSQERELSLIPFPMEEIFDTKLDTFDVVIFQNFGYADPSLSIAEYERNLERYVLQRRRAGDDWRRQRAGRGPGDDAHADARRCRWRRAGPANLEPFKARLTPEGMRHPVTALGGGRGEHGGGVGGAAADSGRQPHAGAAGGHGADGPPLPTVDGKNAPLVAVWDYGRGRAMVVATDASWYWAFTGAQGGLAEPHV